MGVGPDGGCGGSSGGGESWAHSTAAAARASASETGAMILGMAAGWYHAATLNSTCDKSRGCRLLAGQMWSVAVVLTADVLVRIDAACARDDGGGVCSSCQQWSRRVRRAVRSRLNRHRMLPLLSPLSRSRCKWAARN